MKSRQKSDYLRFSKAIGPAVLFCWCFCAIFLLFPVSSFGAIQLPDTQSRAKGEKESSGLIQNVSGSFGITIVPPLSSEEGEEVVTQPVSVPMKKNRGWFMAGMVAAVGAGGYVVHKTNQARHKAAEYFGQAGDALDQGIKDFGTSVLPKNKYGRAVGASVLGVTAAALTMGHGILQVVLEPEDLVPVVLHPIDSGRAAGHGLVNWWQNSDSDERSFGIGKTIFGVATSFTGAGNLEKAHVVSKLSGSAKGIGVFNRTNSLIPTFDRAQETIAQLKSAAAATSGVDKTALLARADDIAFSIDNTKAAIITKDTYFDAPNTELLKRIGARRLDDTSVLRDYDIEPTYLRSRELGPGYHFSAIYKVDNLAGNNVVFGIRGTNVVGDWAQNFKQALGIPSEHYDQAIRTGGVLKGRAQGYVVVGHSKGAGEANAVALIHNVPAFTFNPAGIHPNTILRAKPEALSKFYEWNNPLAHIITTKGDILTGLQDNAQVVSYLINHSNAAFSKGVGVSPIAYPAIGVRNSVPTLFPDGSRILHTPVVNSVYKHSMDVVISSVEGNLNNQIREAQFVLRTGKAK
jgi:hypothetical protein